MSERATGDRAAAIAAGILVAAVATGAWHPRPASIGQIDTSDVLARAASYVARYREALGTVVADERYVQSVNRAARRELRSDVILFSTPDPGDPWIAFRDVREVDGAPPPARRERLTRLLREAPALDGDRWRELVAESARYNLGGIERNMNVPTMTLQLLMRSDQPRVAFEPLGHERLDGVSLEVVGFEERHSPALIRNRTGRDVFASGRIWIEPETGRVVRTEIETSEQTLVPLGARGVVRAELSSTIEVRYRADETLDLWVPATMTERYALTELLPAGQRGLVRKSEITCRADYTDYRRFEVDVRIAVP